MPVYSLQKLALVSADFPGLNLSRQFRVFVDEPRLSQHVRCSVLQLHKFALICINLRTLNIAQLKLLLLLFLLLLKLFIARPITSRNSQALQSPQKTKGVLK